MPSNKPVIVIRTNAQTIEKFKFICSKKNRSMSKQAEKMILDLIQSYEMEYGEIPIEKK